MNHASSSVDLDSDNYLHRVGEDLVHEVVDAVEGPDVPGGEAVRDAARFAEEAFGQYLPPEINGPLDVIGFNRPPEDAIRAAEVGNDADLQAVHQLRGNPSAQGNAVNIGSLAPMSDLAKLPPSTRKKMGPLTETEFLFTITSQGAAGIDEFYVRPDPRALERRGNLLRVTYLAGVEWIAPNFWAGNIFTSLGAGVIFVIYEPLDGKTMRGQALYSKTTIGGTDYFQLDPSPNILCYDEIGNFANGQIYSHQIGRLLCQKGFYWQIWTTFSSAAPAPMYQVNLKCYWQSLWLPGGLFIANMVNRYDMNLRLLYEDWFRLFPVPEATFNMLYKPDHLWGRTIWGLTKQTGAFPAPH
jgi:hypothetical protein